MSFKSKSIERENVNLMIAVKKNQNTISLKFQIEETWQVQGHIYRYMCVIIITEEVITC